MNDFFYRDRYKTVDYRALNIAGQLAAVEAAFQTIRINIRSLAACYLIKPSLNNKKG